MFVCFCCFLGFFSCWFLLKKKRKKTQQLKPLLLFLWLFSTHTYHETCYYTSETIRTVPCKKGTVPFTKRIVSVTNRTVPFKSESFRPQMNRAVHKACRIIYARPYQKPTVPYKKRASCMYGLLINVVRWIHIEIIADQISLILRYIFCIAFIEKYFNFTPLFLLNPLQKWFIVISFLRPYTFL